VCRGLLCHFAARRCKAAYMADASEEYVEPESSGEKVNLLFKLFDKDKDGTVSSEELKRVLQVLDPDTWTDACVNKLLDGQDKDGNGELQFTEFWSWVCGHGKRSQQDNELMQALYDQALAKDKERWRIAQESAAKQAAIDAKKKAKEEDESRKEAEREAGTRISKKQFVQDRVGIGLNKSVVTEMYAKGDEDRDGEIDKTELAWINAEEATNEKQIKGLFQKSAQASTGKETLKGGDASVMSELISIFSMWDKDGNGTISCDELATMLRTLNPKLTAKTATAMIKEVDLDGDGEVDIMEFVAWLSGDNPKKKKQKEAQASKVSVALHMKRAEEAGSLDMQAKFEEAQHKALPPWFEEKKINASCNTLNPGPDANRLCHVCKDRHAWLCHGCGYISYYEECVNGCDGRKHGWTCIYGTCPGKKKCGCKKKPDWWRRKGFSSSLDVLSLSVPKMLQLYEERAAEAEG